VEVRLTVHMTVCMFWCIIFVKAQVNVACKVKFKLTVFDDDGVNTNCQLALCKFLYEGVTRAL